LDAKLYRRRMDMLKMIITGENPVSVIESMAKLELNGQLVIDDKTLHILHNDWSRRANWIPEIVRASSKDIAVFQAEMLGVTREIRKRAFDVILDKKQPPMVRVMAMNTVLSAVTREMDVLKYVTPTPESVATTVETAEDRREALSLILRGLEGADPSLAFNVAKVLSDCDLASLPKLADMK